MEDFEKKYKEALERARIWKEKSGMPIDKQGILDDIFPELGESEGEESKKWILEYLHDGLRKSDEQFKDHFRTAIAWIEKQGKSSDQIHYWTEEEIEPIISDYLRGAEHYGGMIGRLRCLKPKSLEKQGEIPTTISVDKMVEEFIDARIEANGICQIIESDAYREGVTDALSKILIKEEKPITIGSKKAEGKLGEMIAASKEPAESGEDKELSHKEVTKKSDKDSKWSEEDEENLRLVLECFTVGQLGVAYCKVREWLDSIKQRLS